MFYEYKCPHHGTFLHSERDDRKKCPICDTRSTRRFSFSVAPSFQEGYSPTTGTYVNNNAQLVSELNRASDKATERNGIPHRYVPVDLRDRKHAASLMKACTKTRNYTPIAYKD
jgi:hypothetical protein